MGQIGKQQSVRSSLKAGRRPMLEAIDNATKRRH
jgi:hypothetical protein